MPNELEIASRPDQQSLLANAAALEASLKLKKLPSFSSLGDADAAALEVVQEVQTLGDCLQRISDLEIAQRLDLKAVEARSAGDGIMEMTWASRCANAIRRAIKR